jgi:hypothetical protein
MAANPYVSNPVFREHASGLLVPNELSRTRRVWTKPERNALEKARGLLKFHGLALMLKCDNPDCTDQGIVQTRNGAGEPVMQCGCRTHVFSRTV